MHVFSFDNRIREVVTMSVGTGIHDTRCVIYPIDGASSADVVVEIAGEFVAYQEILPYISMIKLNDALHFSRMGPAIIEEVRSVLPNEVGIFADLKIGDVSETVKNTLRHYAYLKPDIVTVSSICTAQGIEAVREILPYTKIALVDTLTDMSEQECLQRYSQLPGEKIAHALMQYDRWFGPGNNPIDIVVSSAVDIVTIQREHGLRFKHLCPGIRDAWMLDGGNSDHQKRIAGIYGALLHGAHYLVMGSQLTRGNLNVGISGEESRRRSVLELEKYFKNRSS